MSRLVVVSNRVPAQGAGAGGLAVALGSALERAGGLWFGWSGDISESPGDAPATRDAGAFQVLTTDLTPEEHAAYYERYSNRTLWPLFHGRVDLASIDREAHEGYRSVNRRFAEMLAPRLEPDDRIWVQDYHLIPLARELRRLGVTTPIGFFLHIPFPPLELLETLPWMDETLDQLAACDLVGFQTERDLHNFRAAADAAAARAPATSAAPSSPRAGVFPIGIDADGFASLAGAPRGLRRAEWLRRRLGGRSMVIGVDRLDYTKGLEERFEAFERLLEIAPELRGRVSLMQIAAPTREGIAEYQAMQEALERLSGHVNGRFGRLDWTPISYINRAYGHEQVAALHRVARVGLVTPLRDGMNLVAKEYVAAQDPDDPGVLVLSRFAGAAEALTDALLVNPHDRDETAEAIRTALAMPKDERQARWARMMDGLRAHDVHRWRQDFLDALDGAVQTAGGGTGGAGRLTRTGRPLKAVASGGAETWAGR